MAFASSIDLHSDDKGLAACLRLANVQDAWRDAFVAKHRPESLEDFVYLVSKNDWEAELRGLLDEVPSLKDSRLVLARFKAAWSSGMAAISAAQLPSSKVESNEEEPIPELQFQQLAADWTRSYGLRIDPHLDPCDSLRARIWREMRRRTLTIIEMHKVKSVVGGASPLDEDKISLEKGVTIQFNKTENQAPRSVIEYYLKLRILCYAWCWSGNFKAKCLDNKEYIIMSLSAAIDYADFVLRHTLLYGNNNLGWMSRLDLMTRGTMAGKVRRGMTAEHALAEALREHHIDWRSQVHAKSLEPIPAPHAPPPARVVAAEDPSNKRRKVTTVSMLKGGRRICKPHNDERGCHNPNCPDAHVCDVRLDVESRVAAPVTHARTILSEGGIALRCLQGGSRQE